MSIIKYQNYLEVGQAGQIATIESFNIKTRNAQESIKFGRAVMIGTNKGVDVKNIYEPEATLTFNADFVVGNTIDLKINGVSIQQVLFDTDHITTFLNLVSAIDALDNIAVITSDPLARTILIETEDALSNTVISEVIVLGGASQASASVVNTTSDSFEGIAVLRHGQPKVVGGDDQYELGDAVNVMTKGVIFVEVASFADYNDDVYVYADAKNPNNQGQFVSNVSAGSKIIVPSARFLSRVFGTTENPVLGKIEINYP